MRTKVIFSTDDNPLYSQFKEPISKAWEKLGFDPVCVYIDKKNCFSDPDLVPLGAQAQIVRVLYPSLYPDQKFIVSDIDMLPLNGDYFHKISNEIIDKETIVNASADAYGDDVEKFPMCYYAGYGEIFSNITGVKKIEDIGHVITNWYSQGNSWNTDEICFFRVLKNYSQVKNINLKLYKRGWSYGMANMRIDRANWRYDLRKLNDHQYIDSHLVRPFDSNISLLRPLFESLGVEI